MAKPRTLYDKIWDDHVIETRSRRHVAPLHRPPSRPRSDEPAGLRGPAHVRAARCARRKRRSPSSTTTSRPPTARGGIADPESRLQVEQLAENAREFGIEYYNEFDPRQGVVHIIGPEQGFTLPGTTIVCGDSHTSTHGAFGALAHGIGTSEVEHVLATQTLIQSKAKNMQRRRRRRARATASTAKDIILAIIGQIGTAGGTGHVIEYAGEAIRALSMEGRMTVCNMSIEGGARAGMVAPDEKTYAYLKDRPKSPKGALWDAGAPLLGDAASPTRARISTRSCGSTPRALPPIVSWGTSPQDVVAIGGIVPRVEDGATEQKRASIKRALDYMGLNGGEKIADSRSTASSSAPAPTAASRICAPRRRSSPAARSSQHVNAMVVPGSGLVKAQAEAEGLDKIFIAAGFEWREPGCSMCLAMNPDKLAPGERCASTSNRNFEGRQGYKGRTHLVSPAMAAAAAIAGRFVDVREWR